MSKLRDLLRRLRDLLTCFRRTVVVIDDVLDDIEETAEMRRRETPQNLTVDL